MPGLCVACGIFLFVVTVFPSPLSAQWRVFDDEWQISRESISRTRWFLILFRQETIIGDAEDFGIDAVNLVVSSLLSRKLGRVLAATVLVAAAMVVLTVALAVCLAIGAACFFSLLKLLYSQRRHLTLPRLPCYNTRKHHHLKEDESA